MAVLRQPCSLPRESVGLIPLGKDLGIRLIVGALFETFADSNCDSPL